MITDRRSIMAGLALVAAAAPVAMAQTSRPAPEIGTVPMNFAAIKTAPQFYMGVLGPAELSLSTSQLAVEKAMQKDAHEFAGFELGEAITVNMVLKDIGAAAPAISSKGTATIQAMKTATGAAFDHAYIGFQLENHEFLRDLADAYLHNSAGAADPMEKQGRHLAMLMLAVFKEHVAICKRINAELKA